MTNKAPLIAAAILTITAIALSALLVSSNQSFYYGNKFGMQTEQLNFTNVTFTGTNIVIVSIKNTGTVDTVVNNATINGSTVMINGGSVTIKVNRTATVNLTSTWIAGNNYQIKLYTSKGNPFSFNTVAS